MKVKKKSGKNLSNRLVVLCKIITICLKYSTARVYLNIRYAYDTRIVRIRVL